MLEKYFILKSSTPSILKNANAGAPSASASISGTDTRGIISITTDVGANVGVLATITFGQAYTVAPFIFVKPRNGNGYTLRPIPINITTTGFDLQVVNDLPLAGLTYDFEYLVIG